MILCYACNQWRPGDVAPFALCDECKQPERQRERDLRHARVMLSSYWMMKPAEQDGLRTIAHGESEAGQ